MTAQIAAYGRIAADIQTKTTSHDKSMAFTRIAVALPCRTTENGESVMWLGVTAFGKQAEALAKHQKGDLVSVSGQLQINQWTGQNGETHSGYAPCVPPRSYPGAVCLCNLLRGVSCRFNVQ